MMTLSRVVVKSDVKSDANKIISREPSQSAVSSSSGSSRDPSPKVQRGRIVRMVFRLDLRIQTLTV
jgi:hypothetical protein